MGIAHIRTALDLDGQNVTKLAAEIFLDSNVGICAKGNNDGPRRCVSNGNYEGFEAGKELKEAVYRVEIIQRPIVP